MFDYLPFDVGLLAFGAVTLAVATVGRYIAAQAHLQRRLTTPVYRPMEEVARRKRALQSFITRHFDERRFGVDSRLREKLRRQLVQAGIFRADALNYYIFARVFLVVSLPSLAYAAVDLLFADQPWLFSVALISISFMLAIVGPDAYLSRRQRIVQERYRQLFPDFLDLLTVCVDAGLGLEAAFDRITPVIIRQSRQFGLNVLMLVAETRAGRITVDALGSFADRIGLDEAHSFVLVLRQSLELGSDVGETLHVFSDEMREKRLLRAEEAANKLPVKMVLPLGLFIFPVILLVALLPIVIRLVTIVFK
jgi:tight adherence protein C